MSRTRPPARRPVRRRRRMRLGSFSGRARFGFAAVATLLLVVGGRLVQLQGLDHRNYAGAAEAQRVDTVTLHALRGEILDRDGTVLSYTSDAQDITADPAQIPVRNRATYAARLAPILQQDPNDLLRLLSQHSQYALLAAAQTPTLAQRIADLHLPGVYQQSTTQRVYPGQTTAANILGTVHSDGSGAAGVEYLYNDVLAGKDGSITYSVDNLGNVNPASRTVTDEPVNGGTVRLTVDQNLQFTVQRYVDAAVIQSKARSAQAVVLDAHNGQVLAMANSGTFNAADPDTISDTTAMNPAVQNVFEPGSVQKAITFAAALQERKITTRSVLTVPDSIYMGGVTVHDAWYHPTVPFTATGVLAKSSNVGTLMIAQQVGASTWYQYEKKFGVGTETGIELPGEASGYVPPLSEWSGSTFANLPFGQGENMTTLQLASIYQTFANNGVRIPPRIVQSVTKSDGSVDVTPTPAGIRVVTPPVAQTVRTMLESVTMPGGTGPLAGIQGYRVAGKTGTAQQPIPGGGGYYDNVYWDTFAGMVPADNPQFVVAIMVDNPAQGLEGGDVAAPLFHEIASYELLHARIPPTGSLPKHVPLELCSDPAVRESAPSTVC